MTEEYILARPVTIDQRTEYHDMGEEQCPVEIIEILTDDFSYCIHPDFFECFVRLADRKQQIREQLQNLLLDKTGGYKKADPLIEKRVDTICALVYGEK